MKMILVGCSIIFAATVVPLIIMNLSNSIESSAQSSSVIEVVNIKDQEFSNEKSIDQPVLISQKTRGEHVIQIREKKIVNAQ